jgi:hypothetical protein
MNKDTLVDSLGKTFKKVIAKYSYPSITPSSFSNRHCELVRTHWNGLPNNNEKLKDKIVAKLLEGYVEEIRDKGNYYIFLLNVKHKSELYLVELKLENYEWDFLSLQYIGEASTKSKAGIVAIFSIVFLLLLGFFATSYVTKETAAPIVEPETKTIDKLSENEDMTVEELHQVAEKMDYILLKKDKYNQLQEEIQNKSQVIEPKKNDENGEEDIIINIKPGMSSEDIANLLVEEGLARSTKEVRELFTQLKINSKIRAGTYSISKDSTYFDLIRQITQKN